LEAHPLRGQIFETFVVSELRKGFLNRGEPPLFYFWRDSNGNEVDLLIETGRTLIPVEIKAGQTLNRDFFTGLERWLGLAGDRARDPTLIYGGQSEQERRGIRVLGWSQLAGFRA
jgi:predicted AAA+ superfamily ATPase